MKSECTELRDIERELWGNGVDKAEYSTDRWWEEANDEYEATTQQVAHVKKVLTNATQSLRLLSVSSRQNMIGSHCSY